MRRVLAGGPRIALPSAAGASVWAGALGGAAVLAATAGWMVVERPDMLRMGVAAAFVAATLAAAPRWPVAAALLTLLGLPFEAFVRRLLTDTAGSAAYDPLILVGPAVALTLAFGLFAVRRRPLVTDALSGIVLAFLTVAIVQVGNPHGGGLVAGAGGLLFVAAPLLWFFLGRALCDASVARILLAGMVVVGAVVGLYALWQVRVGMPAWDRAWVESSGYQALTVGHSIRPFASFSSNQELALWVAGALVVACGLALHGRRVELLAVPILAGAVFLASVRSALLLTLLAAFVICGLRTRRLPMAVAVVVVGVAIAFVGVRAFGGSATTAAGDSGNPLVERQVGGIADPLDQRESTLLLHVDLAVGGVRAGLANPLGNGPAATSLAGPRLTQGVGANAEIDVANAFISLGLLGGTLFVAILALAFWGVTRNYLAGETLALPVLGLLVVLLGQWLTGGMYALLPLFWFLVGWATRRP
jgi:hypothetical protein